MLWLNESSSENALLDLTLAFWGNLFGSLKPLYKWISENDGALRDNYRKFGSGEEV
jgi:phage-related tail protein